MKNKVIDKETIIDHAINDDTTQDNIINYNTIVDKSITYERKIINEGTIVNLTFVYHVINNIVVIDGAFNLIQMGDEKFG